VLWFITNIGIILNKVWDESCDDLFVYLLVMSFISIAGVVIYLYLGMVRYGSDTQWLLLSGGGAVCAMLLSVFLCWGVIRLVQQSGTLGVYQCFSCSHPNGTAVEGQCDIAHNCDANSWSLIYTISECAPATAKGIYCKLTDLCINAAVQTFWYAVVSTGFYLIVLVINALVIFTQLIPSLILQATQRSRLV
jgi:hypothetical protein